MTPAATALLFATCVLTSPASAIQTPAQVELIFLDVGQGDATVIRSPEGKVALIDAGPSPNVVADLRRLGVEAIDIAIASHGHADHIGGMQHVIESIPVHYFLDNGLPHTTPTYRSLMLAIQASDITYLEATDRTISLGSVILKILPPPGRNDQNTNSVGVLVEFGEFKALLTGDSELEELTFFLSTGVPDVTVLKAAHHGSRNGLTPAWLVATKPEVVVVSCGRDNPYGHPNEWAMRYYTAVAKLVLRTDLDGEISVNGMSSGEYTVRTNPRGG